MSKENTFAVVCYCLMPWFLYIIMRPLFHDDSGLVPLAFIGGAWLVVSPIVQWVGMWIAVESVRQGKEGKL